LASSIKTALFFLSSEEEVFLGTSKENSSENEELYADKEAVLPPTKSLVPT